MRRPYEAPRVTRDGRAGYLMCKLIREAYWSGDHDRLDALRSEFPVLRAQARAIPRGAL